MENLYIYDPKSIIIAQIRLEETCISYSFGHYCCECDKAKKLHGLPDGCYCTEHKIGSCNSFLIKGTIKDCLPIGYNFVISTYVSKLIIFHEVTERTYIQALAAIESKIYEKERNLPGYFDDNTDEINSSYDSEVSGKADLPAENKPESPNDKLKLYKRINKLLMNYVERH